MKKCKLCEEYKKNKKWGPLLEERCGCGHNFGWHAGEHPHECLQSLNPTPAVCSCACFNEGIHKEAIYPRLPTAEEIYEKLRGA